MTAADRSGYVQLLVLHADDIPFLLDLEDGLYPKETGVGVLIGALLAEEFDLQKGSRITIGDNDCLFNS